MIWFYMVLLKSFRYCGEYYDKEIDSIYLRARYYNPALGRFTTEDPAKDGLNWYAYCGNNPIMFKDHTGFYEYYIFYNADVDEYNESLKDRAKAQQKDLINKGIKETDIY